MNSVNPFFTFNYSQPEEYRFSHDSVFLARKVFEHFPGPLEGARGLDLCSGCGIVGLDFLFHLKTEGLSLPKDFDFLEVQEIYQGYFEENVHNFGTALPNVNFINVNYEELNNEVNQNLYDIILCNPPYFRVNQGILSPSEFKNRCRFFIDSDFKNLIEGISNALTKNGSAYILLKDLKAHGVSTLEEAQKILGVKRKATVIDDIRGTDLVLIK